MTEYGREKLGRLRAGTIVMTVGPLLLFVGLSFRIGPLWAALCTLAVVALPYLAIALVMRRLAGDGWAASLPLVFAHRLA
jgi:hypothetical protein